MTARIPWHGHFASDRAPWDTSQEPLPACESCGCDLILGEQRLCRDCRRAGWRICERCADVFPADGDANRCSECEEE